MGGIADRNERFNVTDVVDTKLPMRRFVVGGSSSSLVLVSYETGGRGYSVEAVAYALHDSQWSETKRWRLNRKPETLVDLLGIICEVAT